MTVEEEWASLVMPYAAAAESIGFRSLDRQIETGVPPSPGTTFLCMDFYFDGQATFLDLGGTLVRGSYHPGLCIGFNSVQFYTFIRTSSLSLVLTNGIPPAAARRATQRSWNPAVRALKAIFPRDHSGVPMAGPEDLGLVFRTHIKRVGERQGSPVEPTEPFLSSRWELTEEWESSGSW
jgi:hypothetical protein